MPPLIELLIIISRKTVNVNFVNSVFKHFEKFFKIITNY